MYFWRLTEPKCIIYFVRFRDFFRGWLGGGGGDPVVEQPVSDWPRLYRPLGVRVMKPT
jgi:hypothetical protein